MPATPAKSTTDNADLRRGDFVPLPKRLLRVGKYLFPLGMKYTDRRRTRAPSEQASITQIATDNPSGVSLRTLGSAETLAEYAYDCYFAGGRESCVLPSEFFPPAFVAELRNGLSFGRHCCVIASNDKAVRETGFNLNGEVIEDVTPLSRLRMRYWRKRWEGDVTSRRWLPPKTHIEGTVAVLNTRRSHNYYHWLCDILPRLAPIRWAGAKPDFYLVDCLSPFQQSALAGLGIEPHQLIQPHCRLLLQADNLLVPSLSTPACLRELRQMFADGFGMFGQATTARRIFISRRKTGKRTFTNEPELERLLKTYHFETHSMEDYPLTKQAQLVRESEIIVAAHGAGLANLIFARPGTSVIEIVQKGRYNASLYPEKSRIFGLHHQQVLAEVAANRQMLKCSLDDVAHTLSRAASPCYLSRAN